MTTSYEAPNINANPFDYVEPVTYYFDAETQRPLVDFVNRLRSNDALAGFYPELLRDEDEARGIVSYRLHLTYFLDTEVVDDTQEPAEDNRWDELRRVARSYDVEDRGYDFVQVSL